MVVSQFVQNAIIDGAAARVHECRVLCLANFESRNVVRGDVLKDGQRLVSADLDFPHMTNVEQSSCGPDGQVFLDNAGIFHRHFPTSKLNHASPCSPVSLVEWSVFQCDSRRCGQEASPKQA